MSAAENKAVFLSYASQDAEAAKRICQALRTAGVEVWFDQNELVGGDAWDAKIRGQIASCALFVPVISANTQARREGYFRLEWKLAAQRTHMMSERTAFLLPVVIDATSDKEGDVPDEFRAVQWTRLLASEMQPVAAFCTRVHSLLSNDRGATSPVAPVSAKRINARPLGRPRRKWPWLLAAVALALGVFAGWRWMSRERVDAVRAPLADNSVAVLAFKNLSKDAGNYYLSDGISEEISSMLGRVPGLRVAATSSSFQFKEKPAPPAEIGRQLKVAYLLNGSVQIDGQRLRIRAQLVRAHDGFPLWTSEPYDGETKDVFKVQQEIATLITRALRLNLRFAFAGSSVPPEAYRMYLEGRQAWSNRATAWVRSRAQLEKARQFFKSAIDLDPKFGRAYSGLADILHVELQQGQGNWGDRASGPVTELVQMAETALQLDRDTPEAHVSRGLAYWAQWDFGAAERSLRTALRVNPNFAPAYHTLGRVLECAGRMDEALLALSRAAELDPLTSRLLDNYSTVLFHAGRYSAALAHAEQAVLLQPDSRQGREAKVDALAAVGRSEEALPEARRILTSAAAVRALVAAGLRSELDEFFGARRRPPGITTLAALGRHEEVLAELQEQRVSFFAIGSLLFQPDFDPVRSDPRFIEFLAKVGLTSAHERAQKWRARHPPERRRTP